MGTNTPGRMERAPACRHGVERLYPLWETRQPYTVPYALRRHHPVSGQDESEEIVETRHRAADQRAQTVHEMIGGEAALARLVETFYDIIETDPEGASIHALHLKGFGLAHVRQAQFEFLSGFFGGPHYYLERMGHANLRTMHAHIGIGPAEVEAWLTCMRKAIAQLGYDADVAATLMRHFTRSAQALRNTA